MVTATFHFHDELNDFLPPPRRRVEFSVPCARNATTKHMIEALGVPHTEVELITVHGEVAGFDRLLQHGDRVAVYPHLTAWERTLPTGLGAGARDAPRFIADAHLGGLARLLRMAGFDTVYRNDWRDREMADMAIREGRMLLTRDRALLMLRDISHGCYVHALKPAEQFVEIVNRLELAGSLHPFTRCLECNAALQAIDKAQVLHRLPSAVQVSQQQFTSCERCGRIYWKGSHWKRMRCLLDSVLGQVANSYVGNGD